MSTRTMNIGLMIVLAAILLALGELTYITIDVEKIHHNSLTMDRHQLCNELRAEDIVDKNCDDL